MERALAIVDGTEAAKDLVREAGELAAGVDAELLLLHVTTEAEFNDRAEALAGITGLGGAYTVDRARDGARQFAADVGAAVLDEVDVDYEAIGELGDEEETVLDVARRRDVDHIFVSGRQRSPAGKAIFGDTAQSIILEFDGAVTITTH